MRLPVIALLATLLLAVAADGRSQLLGIQRDDEFTTPDPAVTAPPRGGAAYAVARRRNRLVLLRAPTGRHFRRVRTLARSARGQSPLVALGAPGRGALAWLQPDGSYI